MKFEREKSVSESRNEKNENETSSQDCSNTVKYQENKF